MDKQAQALAAFEINQLVQRYGVLADAVDREGFSRCFTAEGVFNRLGIAHRGRAAIAAALGGPPGVKRRNVFAPPLIRFLSDAAATGQGQCLLVQQDESGPLPPASIDYEDEYSLTPEGWLLASRAVRRSF